jgi:hypothetical protein
MPASAGAGANTAAAAAGVDVGRIDVAGISVCIGMVGDAVGAGEGRGGTEGIGVGRTRDVAVADGSSVGACEAEGAAHPASSATPISPIFKAPSALNRRPAPDQDRRSR